VSAQVELFHLVADAPSAHVRKAVTRLGLLPRVSFRNVHFDTHRDALAALGGGAVPAIWDGARLVTGEDGCLSLLEKLARET